MSDYSGVEDFLWKVDRFCELLHENKIWHHVTTTRVRAVTVMARLVVEYWEVDFCSDGSVYFQRFKNSEGSNYNIDKMEDLEKFITDWASESSMTETNLTEGT